MYFNIDMEVSQVRKIYNRLPRGMKNIHWRRLTNQELDAVMNTKQTVSNCYCNSAVYSLLASEKGRDIIKQRVYIQKDAKGLPAYKFILSPKDKKEVFSVYCTDYHQNEYIKSRYEFDKVDNYDSDKGFDLAMNIAVNKMLKKYPDEKPSVIKFISKLIFASDCEYNLPSNAFRWFIGKIPDVIVGENGPFSRLNSKYKQIAKTVLSGLSEKQNENYSYIVLSGTGSLKNKVSPWHCFPILSVNENEETLKILDKRQLVTKDFSFDQLLKNFKAIVGINW